MVIPMVVEQQRSRCPSRGLSKDRVGRELKSVGPAVVATERDHLLHVSDPGDPRDVHDDVNRRRDGLTNAVVRQSDVRRQYAMGESGERLLGGICVDGCEAAQVARIERLE